MSRSTLPTRPQRKRSRAKIKESLYEVLREAFPCDTVDVSDGYKDNIHVLVVSRGFDQMREREKGPYLWRIIDQSDLTDDEKSLVSLVLPVSPAELK